MTTLLVILAAAALGMGIATALRLPVVPLLIVVGLLARIIDDVLERIGWTATGGVMQLDMLQDVLVLGLTFLVFAAGLELNPMRVVQQRRAVAVVGLAQFFAMLGIAMGITWLLGLNLLQALYVGLAVSASSTIVVVRILQLRRQFFEPFGRLVLGVLLLQDLLIILFIAGLSGAETGIGGIVQATLATLGLVMLTWVFARWIAPWLIIKLELDQESLLIVGLAILFSFAGLAYWMNVPLVIGAFFAGVALSGFPVNGVIRGQLLSLNSFFLAVFFVCLGAVLIVPSAQQLLMIIALTALILLVTPALVMMAAVRLGITKRSAIESGLLLAQSSEFSIIVALMGVSAGVLSQGMLSVIAMVTVLTMILTSLLANDSVTWWLVRLHPSHRRHVKRAEPLSDHIIMLGCGSNSRVLLDLLLLHGRQVVVVDEDPSVVQALHERGIEAVRGDGADEDVLRSINADRAYVIISTMRRLEDSARVIRNVGDVKVLVRVFSDIEAERIENAGGVAVCEASAAAHDFFRWYNEFQLKDKGVDTKTA